MNKKDELSYFSSSFKRFFKPKNKKSHKIDRFKQKMIKSKFFRGGVFILFSSIG